MANYKIRQEINLLNAEHVNDHEGAKASSGMMYIDKTEFNNAAIYLEVLAKNSDGVYDGSARMAKEGVSLNNWCSVTIPAGTSSFTRFRSSDGWNDADCSTTWHELNSLLGTSGPTGTITIKAARIIIIQDAADITDTQTQIEIGAYATEVPAAINTDYPLSEPKYWKYESAKWDPTPTFTLGFTVGIEDDMETYKIGIQQASDAAFTANVSTLAASQVTVNTIAVTYYESSAFTPTNNYYYRLVYQGDDTKDDVYFYNAKVIATQIAQPGNIKLGPSGASTYNIQGGSGSDANQATGQSFTPSDGGSLSKISFRLLKVGSPTDNLTVTIYDGLNGSLVTNGTSSTVAASGLGTSYAWVDFTFSTSPSLSASTEYFARIERSGNRDVSNYCAMEGCNPADSANPYSGGDIIALSGGASWVYMGDDDAMFKTYMEPITKLQTEYLMMNQAETGTGNQEDYTYYDPAEWNDEGGSLTFYHEHTASNAADSCRLEYDS